MKGLPLKLMCKAKLNFCRGREGGKMKNPSIVGLWILLETCSHIILDREKVNVISPICISFLDKILSHLLKTLSMNENRVENCMKFKFSFEVYELITVLLSAKLFTDLILILSSEIYCTVCVLVSIILVAFSSLYVPFPKLLLVFMKMTFL